MSFRTALVSCLALTLYLAFPGCTSDPETWPDVAENLVPGMTRKEVESVLARASNLSGSMTYVRNASGGFEPDGPNDPCLVDVAVRYVQKKMDADRERIQQIVVRWPGVWDSFGGTDFLCLFYDNEEKLVDHGWGRCDGARRTND